MLVCDILNSNLIELCFLFKLFKQFVSWSLVPMHQKNMSSMNCKEINEIPSKKGYTYSSQKGLLKIFAYDGTHIAPMANAFNWR